MFQFAMGIRQEDRDNMIRLGARCSMWNHQIFERSYHSVRAGVSRWCDLRYGFRAWESEIAADRPTRSRVFTWSSRPIRSWTLAPRRAICEKVQLTSVGLCRQSFTNLYNSVHRLTVRELAQLCVALENYDGP